MNHAYGKVLLSLQLHHLVCSFSDCFIKDKVLRYTASLQNPSFANWSRENRFSSDYRGPKTFHLHPHFMLIVLNSSFISCGKKMCMEFRLRCGETQETSTPLFKEVTGFVLLVRNQAFVCIRNLLGRFQHSFA